MTKLSKLQLRRIIREEYSRLSMRNNRINESNLDMGSLFGSSNYPMYKFRQHLKDKHTAEKKRDQDTARWRSNMAQEKYYNSPEYKESQERIAQWKKEQAEIEAANKRSAIVNSDARRKLIRDSRAGHLLFLVNSAYPELNIFKYPGDNRVFKQPQFAGQSGDPRKIWLESTCNEILGLLYTGFEVSSEASKKLKLLGDNQGVDFSIDELIAQQGTSLLDSADIFVESLPGGSYRISVSKGSLQALYAEIKALLSDIIESREGKKFELTQGLSNYLRECANRMRKSRSRLQVL